MYHWAGQKQFPTVITIFSAPNYCDFYNNKGAVIKFKVQFSLTSEQHFRHSAIFRKSASIPVAQLYGPIRLVHSIRGWEGDRNALSFDKTWPTYRWRGNSSNRAYWQKRTYREDALDAEIVHPGKYGYYQFRRQDTRYCPDKIWRSTSGHQEIVSERFW